MHNTNMLFLSLKELYLTSIIQYLIGKILRTNKHADRFNTVVNKYRIYEQLD